MKVSGFTFIKNAVKYDFPFIESVTSILPICDEFIIVHGDSEDETIKLIESINSTKIKVYNTVWNPELRKKIVYPNVIDFIIYKFILCLCKSIIILVSL